MRLQRSMFRSPIQIARLVFCCSLRSEEGMRYRPCQIDARCIIPEMSYFCLLQMNRLHMHGYGEYRDPEYECGEKCLALPISSC